MGRTITVPLPLFFTTNAAMSLPLVSLLYQDVRCHIELRKMSDLYTIVDTDEGSAMFGERIRPPSDLGWSPFVAARFTNKETGEIDLANTFDIVARASGPGRLDQTTIGSVKITGPGRLDQTDVGTIATTATGPGHLDQTDVGTIADTPAGPGHLDQTNVGTIADTPAGPGHLDQTTVATVATVAGPGAIDQTTVGTIAETASGPGHLDQTSVGTIADATGPGQLDLSSVDAVQSTGAGAGFVDQTSVRTVASTPSGPGFIDQSTALVVASTPSATGFIDQTAVKTLASTPDGPGYVSNSAVRTVATTAAGTDHVDQTTVKTVAATGEGAGFIDQTLVSIVATGTSVDLTNVASTASATGPGRIDQTNVTTRAETATQRTAVAVQSVSTTTHELAFASAHGFAANATVTVAGTFTLAAPALTSQTTYFVAAVDATTLTLHRDLPTSATNRVTFLSALGGGDTLELSSRIVEPTTARAVVHAAPTTVATVSSIAGAQLTTATAHGFVATTTVTIAPASGGSAVLPAATPTLVEGRTYYVALVIGDASALTLHTAAPTSGANQIAFPSGLAAGTSLVLTTRVLDLESVGTLAETDGSAASTALDTSVACFAATSAVQAVGQDVLDTTTETRVATTDAVEAAPASVASIDATTHVLTTAASHGLSPGAILTVATTGTFPTTTGTPLLAGEQYVVGVTPSSTELTLHTRAPTAADNLVAFATSATSGALSGGVALQLSRSLLTVGSVTHRATSATQGATGPAVLASSTLSHVASTAAKTTSNALLDTTSVATRAETEVKREVDVASVAASVLTTTSAHQFTSTTHVTVTDAANGAGNLPSTTPPLVLGQAYHLGVTGSTTLTLHTATPTGAGNHVQFGAGGLGSGTSLKLTNKIVDLSSSRTVQSATQSTTVNVLDVTAVTHAATSTTETGSANVVATTSVTHAASTATVATVTVTSASIANNAFTTASAHGLTDNMRVAVVATGSTLTIASPPLVADTLYYVRRIDATTVVLHTTVPVVAGTAEVALATTLGGGQTLTLRTRLIEQESYALTVATPVVSLPGTPVFDTTSVSTVATTDAQRTLLDVSAINTGTDVLTTSSAHHLTTISTGVAVMLSLGSGGEPLPTVVAPALVADSTQIYWAQATAATTFTLHRGTPATLANRVSFTQGLGTGAALRLTTQLLDQTSVCHLTTDAETQRDLDVQSIDASTDQLTLTVDHQFATGTTPRVTLSGTAPAPMPLLYARRHYYVNVVDATTVSLHTAVPVAASNRVPFDSNLGVGDSLALTTVLVDPESATHAAETAEGTAVPLVLGTRVPHLVVDSIDPSTDTLTISSDHALLGTTAVTLGGALPSLGVSPALAAYDTVYFAQPGVTSTTLQLHTGAEPSAANRVSFTADLGTNESLELEGVTRSTTGPGSLNTTAALHSITVEGGNGNITTTTSYTFTTTSAHGFEGGAFAVTLAGDLPAVSGDALVSSPTALYYAQPATSTTLTLHRALPVSNGNRVEATADLGASESLVLRTVDEVTLTGPSISNNTTLTVAHGFQGVTAVVLSGTIPTHSSPLLEVHRTTYFAKPVVAGVSLELYRTAAAAVAAAPNTAVSFTDDLGVNESLTLRLVADTAAGPGSLVLNGVATVADATQTGSNNVVTTNHEIKTVDFHGFNSGNAVTLVGTLPNTTQNGPLVAETQIYFVKRINNRKVELYTDAAQAPADQVLFDTANPGLNNGDILTLRGTGGRLTTRFAHHLPGTTATPLPVSLVAYEDGTGAVAALPSAVLSDGTPLTLSATATYYAVRESPTHRVLHTTATVTDANRLLFTGDVAVDAVLEVRSSSGAVALTAASHVTTGSGPVRVDARDGASAGTLPAALDASTAYEVEPLRGAPDRLTLHGTDGRRVRFASDLSAGTQLRLLEAAGQITTSAAHNFVGTAAVPTAVSVAALTTGGGTGTLPTTTPALSTNAEMVYYAVRVTDTLLTLHTEAPARAANQVVFTTGLVASTRLVLSGTAGHLYVPNHGFTGSAAAPTAVAVARDGTAGALPSVLHEHDVVYYAARLSDHLLTLHTAAPSGSDLSTTRVTFAGDAPLADNTRLLLQGTAGRLTAPDHGFTTTTAVALTTTLADGSSGGTLPSAAPALVEQTAVYYATPITAHLLTLHTSAVPDYGTASGGGNVVKFTSTAPLADGIRLQLQGTAGRVTLPSHGFALGSVTSVAVALGSGSGAGGTLPPPLAAGHRFFFVVPVTADVLRLFTARTTTADDRYLVHYAPSDVTGGTQLTLTGTAGRLVVPDHGFTGTIGAPTPVYVAVNAGGMLPSNLTALSDVYNAVRISDDELLLYDANGVLLTFETDAPLDLGTTLTLHGAGGRVRIPNHGFAAGGGVLTAVSVTTTAGGTLPTALTNLSVVYYARAINENVLTLHTTPAVDTGTSTVSGNVVLFASALNVGTALVVQGTGGRVALASHGFAVHTSTAVTASANASGTLPTALSGLTTAFAFAVTTDILTLHTSATPDFGTAATAGNVLTYAGDPLAIGSALVLQTTAGYVRTSGPHGFTGTTTVSLAVNTGGALPAATPALVALTTLYEAVRVTNEVLALHEVGGASIDFTGALPLGSQLIVQGAAGRIALGAHSFPLGSVTPVTLRLDTDGVALPNASPPLVADDTTYYARPVTTDIVTLHSAAAATPGDTVVFQQDLATVGTRLQLQGTAGRIQCASAHGFSGTLADPTPVTVTVEHTGSGSATLPTPLRTRAVYYAVRVTADVLTLHTSVPARYSTAVGGAGSGNVVTYDAGAGAQPQLTTDTHLVCQGTGGRLIVPNHGFSGTLASPTAVSTRAVVDDLHLPSELTSLSTVYYAVAQSADVLTLHTSATPSYGTAASGGAGSDVVTFSAPVTAAGAQLELRGTGGRIQMVSHGFTGTHSAPTPVSVTTNAGGTLPAALTALSTVYYAVRVTDDILTLHSAAAAQPSTPSDNGTSNVVTFGGAPLAAGTQLIVQGTAGRIAVEAHGLTTGTTVAVAALDGSDAAVALPSALATPQTVFFVHRVTDDILTLHTTPAISFGTAGGVNDDNMVRYTTSDVLVAGTRLVLRGTAGRLHAPGHGLLGTYTFPTPVAVSVSDGGTMPPSLTANTRVYYAVRVDDDVLALHTSQPAAPATPADNGASNVVPFTSADASALVDGTHLVLRGVAGRVRLPGHGFTGDYASPTPVSLTVNAGGTLPAATPALVDQTVVYYAVRITDDILALHTASPAAPTVPSENASANTILFSSDFTAGTQLIVQGTGGRLTTDSPHGFAGDVTTPDHVTVRLSAGVASYPTSSVALAEDLQLYAVAVTPSIMRLHTSATPSTANVVTFSSDLVGLTDALQIDRFSTTKGQIATAAAHGFGGTHLSPTPVTVAEAATGTALPGAAPTLVARGQQYHTVSVSSTVLTLHTASPATAANCVSFTQQLSAGTTTLQVSNTSGRVTTRAPHLLTGTTRVSIDVTGVGTPPPSMLPNSATPPLVNRSSTCFAQRVTDTVLTLHDAIDGAGNATADSLIAFSADLPANPTVATATPGALTPGTSTISIVGHGFSGGATTAVTLVGTVPTSEPAVEVETVAYYVQRMSNDALTLHTGATATAANAITWSADVLSGTSFDLSTGQRLTMRGTMGRITTSAPHNLSDGTPVTLAVLDALGAPTGGMLTNTAATPLVVVRPGMLEGGTSGQIRVAQHAITGTLAAPTPVTVLGTLPDSTPALVAMTHTYYAVQTARGLTLHTGATADASNRVVWDGDDLGTDEQLLLRGSGTDGVASEQTVCYVRRITDAILTLHEHPSVTQASRIGFTQDLASTETLRLRGTRGRLETRTPHLFPVGTTRVSVAVSGVGALDMLSNAAGVENTSTVCFAQHVTPTVLTLHTDVDAFGAATPESLIAITEDLDVATHAVTIVGGAGGASAGQSALTVAGHGFTGTTADPTPVTLSGDVPAGTSGGTAALGEHVTVYYVVALSDDTLELHTTTPATSSATAIVFSGDLAVGESFVISTGQRLSVRGTQGRLTMRQPHGFTGATPVSVEVTGVDSPAPDMLTNTATPPLANRVSLCFAQYVTDDVVTLHQAIDAEGRGTLASLIGFAEDVPPAGGTPAVATPGALTAGASAITIVGHGFSGTTTAVTLDTNQTAPPGSTPPTVLRSVVYYARRVSNDVLTLHTGTPATGANIITWQEDLAGGSTLEISTGQRLTIRTTVGRIRTDGAHGFTGTTAVSVAVASGAPPAPAMLSNTNVPPLENDQTVCFAKRVAEDILTLHGAVDADGNATDASLIAFTEDLEVGETLAISGTMGRLTMSASHGYVDGNPVTVTRETAGGVVVPSMLANTAVPLLENTATVCFVRRITDTVLRLHSDASLTPESLIGFTSDLATGETLVLRGTKGRITCLESGVVGATGHGFVGTTAVSVTVTSGSLPTTTPPLVDTSVVYFAQRVTDSVLTLHTGPTPTLENCVTFETDLTTGQTLRISGTKGRITFPLDGGHRFTADTTLVSVAVGGIGGALPASTDPLVSVVETYVAKRVNDHILTLHTGTPATPGNCIAFQGDLQTDQTLRVSGTRGRLTFSDDDGHGFTGTLAEPTRVTLSGTLPTNTGGVVALEDELFAVRVAPTILTLHTAADASPENCIAFSGDLEVGQELVVRGTRGRIRTDDPHGFTGTPADPVRVSLRLRDSDRAIPLTSAGLVAKQDVCFAVAVTPTLLTLHTEAVATPENTIAFLGDLAGDDVLRVSGTKGRVTTASPHGFTGTLAAPTHVSLQLRDGGTLPTNSASVVPIETVCFAVAVTPTILTLHTEEAASPANCISFLSDLAAGDVLRVSGTKGRMTMSSAHRFAGTLEEPVRVSVDTTGGEPLPSNSADLVALQNVYFAVAVTSTILTLHTAAPATPGNCVAFSEDLTSGQAVRVSGTQGRIETDIPHGFSGTLAEPNVVSVLMQSGQPFPTNTGGLVAETDFFAVAVTPTLVTLHTARPATADNCVTFSSDLAESGVFVIIGTKGQILLDGNHEFRGTPNVPDRVLLEIAGGDFPATSATLSTQVFYFAVAVSERIMTLHTASPATEANTITFLGDLTDNQTFTIKGTKEQGWVHTTWGQMDWHVDVNYVFLDRAERNKVAAASNEFLIEQVQRHAFTDVAPARGQSLPLQLRAPVKALVWVAVRRDNVARNIFSNYTNWRDPNLPPGSFGYYRQFGGAGAATKYNFGQRARDIIQSATLRFQDAARFETRDHAYFSTVQRYLHKLRGGNQLAGDGRTVAQRTHVPGVMLYSFALEPAKMQPSGACNMSRVEDIELVVDLADPPVDETVPVYDVHVYSIHHNMLRFAEGMLSATFEI